MEHRTDATFIFDHTPPVDPEPPSPRPPPRALLGFYKSESAVYYVTADARVFLVRTAEEPACLHQLRVLPATAIPASARIDPVLEILARTAEELSKPTTSGMRSIRAEVRRDRLVAVGALLQETLACVSDELGLLVLDESPPDPVGLHERLSERIAVVDRQRQALDNLGINRRGDRANVPAPKPDVPHAAASFLHRGEYLGSFMGLNEASETFAPWLPGRTVVGMTAIRNAHLRGELWTMARDGLVYVFCDRPSSASTTTA